MKIENQFSKFDFLNTKPETETQNFTKPKTENRFSKFESKMFGTKIRIPIFEIRFEKTKYEI